MFRAVSAEESLTVAQWSLAAARRRIVWSEQSDLSQPVTQRRQGHLRPRHRHAAPLQTDLPRQPRPVT